MLMLTLLVTALHVEQVCTCSLPPHTFKTNQGAEVSYFSILSFHFISVVMGHQ